MHSKPDSSTIESFQHPGITQPAAAHPSARCEWGRVSPDADPQQAITLLVLARRITLDAGRTTTDIAHAARLLLQSADIALAWLWHDRRHTMAPSGIDAKLLFAPIIMGNPLEAGALADCVADLNELIWQSNIGGADYQGHAASETTLDAALDCVTELVGNLGCRHELHER